MERSFDGYQWTSIYEVSSPQQMAHFEYQDELANKGIKVYYRLKELNQDKDDQIFETKQITLQCKIEAPQIYPNPSSGSFNITYQVDAQVQIFNVNGQLVHEMEINTGVNEIKDLNLNPGIYWLRIKSSNSFYNAALEIK